MTRVLLIALLLTTSAHGVARAQLLQREPSQFRVALGEARRALRGESQRGRALLEAAATLPGADGRALADLGWVLTRNGETFDGLVALARAEHRSRDPRVRAAIFYSTGVAQEASGRPQAAMGAYLRSQELRPHPRTWEAAVALDARHPDQGLGVDGQVAWLEPAEEGKFYPRCDSDEFECESIRTATIGGHRLEVVRAHWLDGYDDDHILLRHRSGDFQPVILESEWRGAFGGEWSEVTIDRSVMTPVEGRRALRLDTRYTMVDHDACEAFRVDVTRTFLCFLADDGDGDIEGCLGVTTGRRLAKGPGRLAYVPDVDMEAECGIPRSLEPAEEQAAIFSPPRLRGDSLQTSTQGVRLTGAVVPPALTRWQSLETLLGWSHPYAMDIFDRHRPFEGVPYELRQIEPPEPAVDLPPVIEAVAARVEREREEEEEEAPPPEPGWGERALRLLEDL